MRRFLFSFIGCISLAGCATVQSHLSNAGQALCRNADAMRAAFSVMISNAVFIDDPVIRQAVINSANAGIAALAECPVDGVENGGNDSATN